jgi:transposase
MAKKAKKIKTKKGFQLKIVNPDAAGIDISSTQMQVCVPLDRDADYNRKFGVFTEDLEQIVQWLQACKIQTVAMESTGIYWVPLFLKIQESGIEVYLVNAKSVSNFVEDKTDEIDAESLMLMHSYGLLRASYQVNNSASEIRTLNRHRENQIRSLSKEVQHMQKYMELMNIKLAEVLRDITGKSGMAIIEAILSGERDTKQLSNLVDCRCKNSKTTIAKALEGNWNEDLLFALLQSYELYKFIHEQIKQCEEKLDKFMQEYGCNMEKGVDGIKEVVRSNKQRSKKTALSFDIESIGSQIFGVNLMRIPGIGEGSLLKLIGEFGHDFTEKFDNDKKFSRWANVVPKNKITGGKKISSKVSKHKSHVGQVLREAANSAGASKTPLGDYYRRIRSRKGPMSAIVATANKMSKIIYIMVKTQTEYDEKRIRTNEPDILKKKLKYLQQYVNKIQEQIDYSENLPNMQSV